MAKKTEKISIFSLIYSFRTVQNRCLKIRTFFLSFSLGSASVSSSYSKLEDVSLLALTKHMIERDKSLKSSIIKISEVETNDVSPGKVCKSFRYECDKNNLSRVINLLRESKLFNSQKNWKHNLCRLQNFEVGNPCN